MTRNAQLGELQRLRLLGAMTDVACERGAANASITHVVERSGVSRRTFYEQFVDREECFLAALNQALACTVERVVPAYEGQQGWRARIRAGLVEMLALFDAQPQLGRMLLCESLAGGPRALALRDLVVARLTEVVEAGGAEGRGTVESLPLLGEGVVGGVLTVLQKRLSDPGDTPLLALANSLMGMIVLPYLGASAAKRELNMPVEAPASDEGGAPFVRNHFKESGMRMTYRTVCVLLAIGDHAEASNRAIGRSAGVPDQGQISKLLSRLQRVGLIENAYTNPGRGAANAWRLTEKGRRLTENIRVPADTTSHASREETAA
ncbi:MAG TPA: TetR family transcriptional regulator [Solirubrobacteraceae bacterium]|nr:TetR family transcriptional regulator [Solirubrobacteraceae bacterium]